MHFQKYNIHLLLLDLLVVAMEKRTQYNFQKSGTGFVIGLRQNEPTYTTPTSAASNKEAGNSTGSNHPIWDQKEMFP